MSGTVAIIDGGGANIASLRFALERLGRVSVLTSDEDTIRAASHVILPGVGAAKAAMEKLAASGLDQVIPMLTQPVLGICLGMQLLFEHSEEEDARCLGVMAGTARRFEPTRDLPVPHTGWNQVTRTADTPLFAGVPDDAYCYFVHSFALAPGPTTIAISTYGREFSAIAMQDNFVAAQFHPERSGTIGASILRNFLTLR